ncbi:uncharacterized protein LOC132722588 [Ruditapes philippinarum]|uniref:uncharacterized protein LOC132722588 n=1 Tax=Ruditapes philippinarum TaxID=129788 RepID=UPI00295B2321|nr:uncharacterized protein LOC132722588 [Ruditapes philippinarum]
MPRGRGCVRPQRLSRNNTARQPEPARSATRSQQPSNRGRKRTAEVPLEDFVDERVSQTNAGESNVVDFEQIIRASNIIPKNLTDNVGSAANNVSTGCGNMLQSVGLDSSTANHSNDILNVLPGIRLADDDLAAHVPTSLKQKICRGEYVNLMLLLKGAVELSEFCKGTVFKLDSEGHIESAQKECKEQINCIEKWTNAFIIYASIYLSSHADKIYEILHYMFNIRDCASRQGGLSWRTYDEQFRLRQAIAPQSWSKINNELWWRCVQVRPVLRDQSQGAGLEKIQRISSGSRSATSPSSRIPLERLRFRARTLLQSGLAPNT